MTVRRDWSREELILAMNLYCQLPFGRLHKGTPEIIELANAIGRTPSSVAMKLSNLASLDPVHRERGVKGLSSASNMDRKIWGEFHDNWEELAAESESLRLAKLNPDAPKTLEQLVDSEPETETQRLTKVRLAQGFFRRTILASYDMRCCVTGLANPSLLVASHILPWSNYPAHRINPMNGLCLNNLFDRAFDCGLITFDEEFRVVLSHNLKDFKSDPAISQFFIPYSGVRLRQPFRFLPASQFLETHRNNCFRG